MYSNPVGGVAAGFGGAAATAPWLGVQAVWVGLAVKRLLPRREH